MFPAAGTSHTRLRQILTVLRGPADDVQRLDALTQLCDYLSVGSEEAMASFSIDTFVPPLVALLSDRHTADTMLLAARALTHMMDALPASAASISHHNAAPALCANLLTIEYIDLAEQSLSALEKLSVDFPQPIVRAGGFAAALSFIDFFSTGVQRVAAVTACNMCRSLPSDAVDKIVDVLPAMMNLLNSEDQRIRESAMLGFSRLAESFRTASDKLELLCGGSEDAPLVERVMSLIVPTSPPALAPASYSAALRFLSTLSRGSAKLSVRMLATEALVFKIRSLLAGGASPHSQDCLTLADALLPETDPATDKDTGGAATVATTSLLRSSRRRRSSSGGSGAAYAAIDAMRRESLADSPETLSFLGATLLPSLLAFYHASADSTARRTALSVIAKFMALAPESVLEPLVVIPAAADAPDAPRFAPFVAGLLSENCSISESLAGLSLANSALSKIPAIKTLFAREGVVHELKRLEAIETSTSSPSTDNVIAMSSASPSSVAASAATALATATVTTAEVTVTAEDAVSPPVAPASSADRLTGDTDASGQDGNGPENASTLAIGETARLPENIVSSALPIPPATPPDSSGPAAAMTAALQAAVSARLPMRLSTLRQTSAVSDSSAATVTEVAKAVVARYLSTSTDESEAGACVLDQLVAVANGLTAASKLCTLNDHSCQTLLTFAAILGKESGMSTFELSRSGVVDALVLFLDAKDLPVSVRTDRTVAFVEAMNVHSSKGVFGLLIARVLGVFASEEKLPLCVSEAPGGHSSSSIGSGLRQLAMPFKLCLRRASTLAGGAGLRDYSHHIVMIEPLATMSSVQDFLWSRVQGEAAEDDVQDKSREDGGSPNGMPEQDIPVDHDEDGAMHDDEDDDGEMDDEDLGEDHDEGGEEAMFMLDEERAQFAAEHGAGEDGHNVDDGYSSEEMIGEDDGGDDGMDGPSSFGPDQLGSSLPPVELDHDALARSLAQSPRHPSGLGVVSGSEDASGSGGAVAAGATGSSRPGPGRSRRNSTANAAGSTGTAANPSSIGTSRSYAAALAAGMQYHRGDSASHASPAGGRRPGSLSSSSNLSFTMNGRLVSKDSSILHAVLHSRSDGVTVSPRLWTEVYTLTYSKGPSTGAAAERDKAGTSLAGTDGITRPTRRSRRLSGQPVATEAESIPKPDAPPRSATDENVELVVVPELESSEVLDRSESFVPPVLISEELAGSIRNIISLLRHFSWVTRSLREESSSRSTDPMAVAIVAITEQPSQVSFQSQKITAKLQRQLSDPLALCGGAIPKWCHILAREASFLVPFETRQVLFQSTALGVPRALHLLQLRSDVSSVAGDIGRQGHGHRSLAVRDSEARINRIQRQKVRIHRSRVLESAMRVMSMYSSHATVLEVEYFDEVGTGLGPTLEFYTLVSREIQRADLGLWRAKESVKKTVAKDKMFETSRTATSTTDISSDRKDDKSRVATSLRIAVPEAKSSLASTRIRRRSSVMQASAIAPLSSGLCVPPRRERDSEDKDVEYIVPTGNGLMPSCIPAVDTGASEYAQRLAYFPFVGRLVAKALADGRLLDLRLSPVFCKLLLTFCAIVLKRGITTDTSVVADTSCQRPSHESASILRTLDRVTDAELWREFADGVPGLVLLRDVDAQLASSLNSILDMAIGPDKASIADLCLSFVLPENDQIEVVDGGKHLDVSCGNSVEYVAAVVRFVLCSGVRRQAEAFLRGFGDVLDIKSLLLFQPHELELLICGPAFEEWSTDFLVQATKCDHGFRHESEAVVSLLRVMAELNAADQRRFVMFATGSPALPVGGLMGLHPRLTIVKRTPEGGRPADQCLPTVMTCTNYFKLPDYSSYEITKSRLLYALREGQGSFHLS
jgi:E3 ubiquitin-protein ligase TRIP12